MATHHHKLETSSKSDEHYTPAKIKDALLLFNPEGFSLDPCSNSATEPNIVADCHYTIDHNGLAQPWFGSVFCNPPFSAIKPWATKAIQEISRGEMSELIFLSKFDGRVSWFSILMEHSNLYCVVQGYCRYGEMTTPATFTTVLWYFGEREERFYECFSSIGWVCTKLPNNKMRC